MQPDAEGGFSLESELLAPLTEEALYRLLPLTLFPNLPFGATAIWFAVDHVFDDVRRYQNSCGSNPMTLGQMVARFGDVLLGGVCYEYAMRRDGYLAAVAAHSAHNAAVAAGVHLRGGTPWCAT